jgi:hypothetical protein
MQSVEVACAAIVAAKCKKAGECLPAELSVNYGTAEACIERESLLCTGIYAAPGTSRTPAMDAACAEAIAAMTCDRVLHDPVPEPCLPPAGTLPDGRPCGSSAQCESGYCRFVQPNICGACTSKVGAGEACLGRADCLEGLGCGFDSTTSDTTTSVCMPYGTTVGSTCPCGPGLYCQNSTMSCQMAAEAGNPCAEDFDCASFPYRVCNTRTKQCEDIAVASAGEICGATEAGGYVDCAEGGACSAFRGQGTWLAPAADGASCGGTPCLAPAQCIGGTCIVFSTARCR